jgi:hypothetical protein
VIMGKTSLMKIDEQRFAHDHRTTLTAGVVR